MKKLQKMGVPKRWPKRCFVLIIMVAGCKMINFHNTKLTLSDENIKSALSLHLIKDDNSSLKFKVIFKNNSANTIQFPAPFMSQALVVKLWNGQVEIIPFDVRHVMSMTQENEYRLKNSLKQIGAKKDYEFCSIEIKNNPNEPDKYILDSMPLIFTSLESGHYKMQVSYLENKKEYFNPETKMLIEAPDLWSGALTSGMVSFNIP